MEDHLASHTCPILYHILTRQRILHQLPICIIKPAGRICCPADAEYGALESAFQYILEQEPELKSKRIFIGCDAQSILKALEDGPRRPYRYLGIDTSPLWANIKCITKFCKELVLHHRPAHVGITGNEIADEWAKQAATTFSTEAQDQICASLSNLKSYLRTKTLDQWNIRMNNQLIQGFRRSILQNNSSRLKNRITSPRPLQTLLSRYRCDRVETAGNYSRRLNYINNPSCRFCGHPRETLSHLLDEELNVRWFAHKSITLT